MLTIVAILFTVVIFLLLVKGGYNFLRAIILRGKFLHKLEKTCLYKQYRIQKVRPFLASFFRRSDAPDLILTIGDTEYLIRFITCQARKRFYYFITQEYYVRSLRLFTHLPTAVRLDSAHYFAQRKHVPPLNECFLNDDTAMRKQLVFLLNPIPAELYYMDRIRKCRMPAENGVQLENYFIYSATGFLDLLLREK